MAPGDQLMGEEYGAGEMKDCIIGSGSRIEIKPAFGKVTCSGEGFPAAFELGTDFRPAHKAT